MTEKKTVTEAEKKVIEAIAQEIVTERENQILRWGTQDHKSYHSLHDVKQAEKAADRWKQINDARVKLDIISWDGILLEEVHEALAETDIHKRRAELIQVAAVAAAEVEALDRQITKGDIDAEGEDEGDAPVPAGV